MSEKEYSVDTLLKYKNEEASYLHVYDLDIKANAIYLMGMENYILPDSDGAEPGVEFSMANQFIKNLNILMRHSDKPILIHMKTCGGFWEEGMAIYDAIQACPNPITILNYTHARSMSSIIFQAANRRVMMPNSTFMFHGGTIGMEGTYKQFMNESKEAAKTQEIMLNIYIDSMKKFGKGWKKKSRKDIKEWLENQMDKKEEVYMDAKQAVQFGFADQIFGTDGHYDWAGLTEF